MWRVAGMCGWCWRTGEAFWAIAASAVTESTRKCDGCLSSRRRPCGALCPSSAAICDSVHASSLLTLCTCMFKGIWDTSWCWASSQTQPFPWRANARFKCRTGVRGCLLCPTRVTCLCGSCHGKCLRTRPWRWGDALAASRRKHLRSVAAGMLRFPP